jgi:hypothetical protein
MAYFKPNPENQTKFIQLQQDGLNDIIKVLQSRIKEIEDVLPSLEEYAFYRGQQMIENIEEAIKLLK